jgi:signal transduction histidine kinase
MLNDDILIYEQKIKRNSNTVVYLLFLIISITVCSNLFINYKASNYNNLINKSGRQRMLSQKLSYLKLLNNQDNKYKNTLLLFKKSQTELKTQSSPEMKHFYSQYIDDQFKEFIDTLNSPDVSNDQIHTESSKTLFLLDRVVTQFEFESNKYEHHRMKINIISILSSILIIILLNKFILIPQRIDIIKNLRLYILERDRSRKSLQIKNNFLANMTHELRTPMNVVIGATDHLEDTIDQKDSSQNESFKVLKVGNKALLEVINNILDTSKIENNRFKLEPSEFITKDLVEELNIITNQLINNKNIIFEIKVNEIVPKIIYADYFRIKQVLINLLANAVKFTKDGVITLNINYRNDQLQVEVQDTGIGIKEEDKDKIFEIFHQISNPYTKSYQGSGQGLYLVKKIIMHMHGEINLESTIDIGSTFSFSVPIKTGNFNNITTIDKVDLNAEIGLILIAEDNKMNQLVIGNILKKLSLNFEFANNGKQALEMFKQYDYALILMDLSMPIMDGFEASTEIRKINQEIPIFALTANAFEDANLRAYECGMNEFITKPIDKNKLISVLNSYFTK